MKFTAGILLYRITKGKIELLLVHNGKTWSLPKGNISAKESPKAAACRELLEETKLKAPSDLIDLGHVVDFQKPEQLRCFIAEYTKKKNPMPAAEIRQCGFVPLNRAKKLIAPYQIPLLECLFAIEKLNSSAA